MNNTLIAELKRKAFHLLGFSYVLGMIYIPKPALIITLVIVTVILFLLDWIRIKWTPANEWFRAHFQGFMRQRESQTLSGMPSMAAGALGTVLILNDVSLMVTAFLYLLLGDTMASLVGIRFRGPCWPKTQKTISGSAGCFVMCVLTGWMVLGTAYGVEGILIGAFVATLAEFGLGSIDDNFLIPILSAAFFYFFFSAPAFL